MPKNIEPAILTLNFEIGDTNVSYIDLSQCASIVNRRFYRQGLNWAVAGFRFGFEGSGVNLRVATLPNAWTTSGSWEKTMRAWLKQQNDAIREMGGESAVARYRDFKVHADSIHEGLGFGSNKLPVNPGGLGVASAAYLPGEWEASQIVIPNNGAVGVTTEYNLHMLGASNATSKSIIAGYANSRATPFSPDPVTPGPISNSFLNSMFDVGFNNDDIVDNATDKNDDLPYDRDDYPGELVNGPSMSTHREISFTTTTIGAHQNMAGTNVPCGLLQIAHNHVGAANTLTMQIMLVPGDHRGYMAEPMTEM
ncbi:MAG: hypothetical protein [Circoviridae sp.]|nr:MAG: hypothetical protein [Circoviridae sp.]